MATGMERRQVFDLPERPIEVTEHRGLVYACPSCGGRTRSRFPAEASGPAQYGERVRALAVYLNAQQRIPEDRTAETLSDLFGARGLCAASVAQWTRARAEALAPVVERIEALIRASRVRCLDETGLADRRQDAMAAYGGRSEAYPLSRLRPARRNARAARGRRGRP
jgi:transposase